MKIDELKPCPWYSLKQGDLVCDEHGKDYVYIAGPDKALLAGVCVEDQGILKIMPASVMRWHPVGWLKGKPLYPDTKVKYVPTEKVGFIIRAGYPREVLIRPEDKSFLSMPVPIADLEFVK